MSDKVKIRVDLRSKEDTSNKTTSLSSSSTNTQYPSAKAVYDAIAEVEAGSGGAYIDDYYWDSTNKQIVLVYSNNGSGGGSGGSSVDIVTSWEQTPSDEKVASEKLVKDSLDAKSDSNHTHNQYLTEHQSLANYVQKETGKGLFSGSYGDLTNKPSYTPTVTSGTTGAYKIGSININGSDVDIYGKDTDTAPPSASTTTPSADTQSGSYGSGTSYARSNHSHPKSSIYAEANHNHTGTYANATHSHTYTDLTNVTTVEVEVTYTDNSTETIKLLKYTGT